jgi:16S rRNA (cytosine967-C5)-methyltransferase
VLVYSTCTISPTENEQVVRALLDSQPDFSFDEVPRPRADPAAGARLGTQGGRGTLLTLPHRDHTAGFFIARLRRS